MAFERKDPFGGYNFAVEMDGITRMGFKMCSGLDSTSDATKYREGTDATLAQRQLPGLLTFSNISLQRGLTDDHALWDWRDSIAGGAPPVRRTISIILRDAGGNEKVRWNVKNCWPVKWTGPSFDATTDAVAIETLELAHEGIEVQEMVMGGEPTEFPFTLPHGYLGPDGAVHRDGAMRMSTAYDEIAPLKDPRVQSNPGYLVIILLSRVIVRLGAVQHINPKVIEGLYSGDLVFLQELYRRINENGHARLHVSCPHCQGEFEVEASPPGEA